MNMRMQSAALPRSPYSYKLCVLPELPKALELYDFKNLKAELPSPPLALPSTTLELPIAIQKSMLQKYLKRLLNYIPQSRGQQCFLQEELTKILLRLDDIDLRGNPGT
jgi:hypothetical protein